MCYAASERLARQSLLAALRLVAASLRALIDLMLVICFFILIIVFRCALTYGHKVLTFLMHNWTAAVR